MNRFMVVAMSLAPLLLVGGCSKALTETSASPVIQKWIDSQNTGIVSTFAGTLTTNVGPEMIVPWSSKDARRLINEGYIEEKTISVSYPNFSGQYSGVFHQVNMFSVLVSEPTVVTIDIQTVSSTRPPHVEGQFKACEGPDCSIASVSGSVRRSATSTLSLTFPNGSKDLEVALERGQTDAMVGHYDASGWGHQSYFRADHVGPNPVDVKQEVYVYRWAKKLPVDTFSGAELILGHLEVESCEHLLMASETTANALCKTHVKLTPGGEAIFGSRSTEGSLEAAFGKQPDGTWIGTSIKYTAPPYTLSQ